jgi:hypothetical protein
MRIDLKVKTDQELENLIENFRQRARTDDPLFLAALEERALRRGKGFTVDKSLQVIRDAARKRRFVGYTELASANGLSWNEAHFGLPKHLWDLVVVGHHRGLGMLSAICVNTAKVATGEMEPSTLKGFIEAAKEIGQYDGSDPEKFLRRQQEEVFAKAGKASEP